MGCWGWGFDVMELGFDVVGFEVEEEVSDVLVGAGEG